MFQLITWIDPLDGVRRIVEMILLMIAHFWARVPLAELKVAPALIRHVAVAERHQV